MLLNRISLRVATAVGSAAMVAGATFAVSAYADSGEDPERSRSAASAETDPAKTSKDFFADVEKVTDAELKKQREAAKEKIDKANGASVTSGASTTKPKEKEEEKQEEDSGDSPIPSGDPKGIAKAMLGDFGWGTDQFSCLEPLWDKESKWDPSAENPSTGAYGIPQALPGSKMASAGSDWKTNPATQIEWGLGYIEDRYGSPCEAWSHSKSNGWY